MALSDERLDAIRQADSGALNFVTLRQFRAIARAIEAEVRKQDEALIRQMLAALMSTEKYLRIEVSQAYARDANINTIKSHERDLEHHQDLISAARTRLES